MLIEKNKLKKYKIMNNQNKTRIVFYLDFNDKILLNNQCELLQVKASFYIRQCVLEKLGKPILEVKQKHLETKNYTLQLYKIGNNLNQISRKLNSGIKLKLTDEDLIINDIEELKKHIIDIQSKLN
ncbi:MULTISPECIES: plasmid mobilization relaxosome protein MobC [Polaribacter]|uniref:Bacterial mobilisation domain-containing protein n=2 Tax=Polaribacter sejongensis TaxID=985043 RepID=A0ABM6PYR7_9FLAO|nr:MULTISPECIES: plasmid mobilization relaxosome protein MobC [Polaribacter]AUC21966.1 hypothetical protein BTO15_07565 [Polaribacter sejongensis]